MIHFINQFNRLNIMVIGDLIADEFIVGKPERLSREAPVLILRQQEKTITPGGGANAANNICSLGGRVKLVGVLGNDDSGQILKRDLLDKGIDVSGVVVDYDRPTTVKSRILAGGEQVVKQQIARVDNLDDSPIKRDIEDGLLSYIRQEIDTVDGLLLSDYGNGVMTDRLKKEIITLAKYKNKFVAVDSRYNLLDYQGATFATPNLEEVSYALDRKVVTQDDVVLGGKELLAKLKLEYLVITQGGEGMTFFTNDGEFQHIPPTNFTEVFDVTGAGDTVVGTLCLAVGSGADIYTAVKLANYAAGIVVRKRGVATTGPEELKEVVLRNER